MQEALDIFADSLPAKPYATDDLATELLIYNKGSALRLQYVQLNGIMRRFIPLDIDRTGAAFAWEDANLPQPTIVTVNPANAHAHMLYGLHEPVTFKNKYGQGNARNKPVKYFNAVREAYRARLGADPAYAGVITKNPLNSRWETITTGRFYDLHELAEYVDLSQVRLYGAADDYQAPQGPIIEGFRNDTLFNYARKWAYGKVRGATSTGDLFDAVFQHCQGLNAQCIPPLPTREVHNVARSITRYCWGNRATIIKGCSPNRGIMGFDPLPPAMEANKRIEEVHCRKALGALHTNETRRRNNEAKILDAISQLKDSLQRVTKKGVSRMTGISQQTISTVYGHLFH